MRASATKPAAVTALSRAASATKPAAAKAHSRAKASAGAAARKTEGSSGAAEKAHRAVQLDYSAELLPAEQRQRGAAGGGATRKGRGRCGRRTPRAAEQPSPGAQQLSKTAASSEAQSSGATAGAATRHTMTPALVSARHRHRLSDRRSGNSSFLCGHARLESAQGQGGVESPPELTEETHEPVRVPAEESEKDT